MIDVIFPSIRITLRAEKALRVIYLGGPLLKAKEVCEAPHLDCMCVTRTTMIVDSVNSKNTIMHKTENCRKSTKFTTNYIQHQPNDVRNPNLYMRNPNYSAISRKTDIPRCFFIFRTRHQKVHKLVCPYTFSIE